MDLKCFNRQHLRHLRSGFCPVLFWVPFLLLFNSCTPEMFKGLKKTDSVVTVEKIKIFHPVLNGSLVYKTSVSFRDKEFSSLTYVNSINDSVFKIVLLTTFGNTLLEAEISREKFTVNNVISYLDRRPLLKIFEKDWRLLLAGNLSPEIPLAFPPGSGELVFDYKQKRTNHLYHYNLDKKSVVQAESFSGKNRKVIVMVNSYRDSQPESFTIEHPSLHLKMNMTLLKKVNNDPAE